MVTFDGTTSEDKTLNAVDELRHVVDANSVSSMSAMVLDTKNLSDQEINIIYNFIKENYNSLLEQDTSSFELLKNQLNKETYNEIINLYNKYKKYI